MSAMDHIEALKGQACVARACNLRGNARPHPNDDAICSLKKRKLQIKDEITRLHGTLDSH